MPKYPHDYYKHPDGMPHLHHHDPAHYLEHDIYANDHDRSLPTLSTIGRGPKGKGVIAKVLKNDIDGYVFGLYDDETNELLYQSPNLGIPYISIDVPSHEPVPGEIVHAYLNVKQGDGLLTYDIEIPSGVMGSRIYCLEQTLEPTLDNTYAIMENDLYFYRLQEWLFHHSDYDIHEGKWITGSKPAVRVNDIIIAKIKQANGVPALTFGTVNAVENNQVVFTCRTFIDSMVPYIGEDGYWYIDDESTGIKAKGEKGDKGDTPIITISKNNTWVIDGKDTGLSAKGDKGETGATGKAGKKGDKGDKGDNAKVAIGDVTTVPSGVGASVTDSYDKETNTTTFNFAIPEGPAGKAIDIQGGIWYWDTLPDFDETPVNTAFIVYDGDRQFDLYVRGRLPVHAELGGPWTVVEDWQGRPGTGVHVLLDPYYMDDTKGSEVEIPAADAEKAFNPSDILDDGEIIIDTVGHIGILGSSVDNSGTYTVTTVGQIKLSWEHITNAPFESLGDVFNVEEGVLDINTKPLGKTEIRALIEEVRNSKLDKVDNNG